MKIDLNYLPEWRRQELIDATQAIRSAVHYCERIILYGNFAPDNYRAEEDVFPSDDSYRNDYDVLVLTGLEPSSVMAQKLNKVDSDFFNNRRTPIQFLILSVRKMNKFLSAGHFYYTRICQEGVCLYDSGKQELAPAAPLDFEKIRIDARQYYQDKMQKGRSFIRCATHDYDDGDYQLLSFHIHQAFESFFTAILLTFTLSSRKVHDLHKLLRLSCKFVPELQRLFYGNENVFRMVKKAYREGRYNDRFNLSEADARLLQEKIGLMQRLVEEACSRQLEKYDRLAENAGTETPEPEHR